MDMSESLIHSLPRLDREAESLALGPTIADLGLLTLRSKSE
jgi:hypothetical protein